MSTCRAFERSLLTFEEWALVGPSHYPEVAEIDAAELRDLRGSLKAHRAKSKTLTFGQARAGAAGAPTGPNIDRLVQRKQVFSHAVKRVNKQLARLDRADAVGRTRAGQERALAMRRRAAVHHPSANGHARRGVRDNPSLRRAMGVNPAKVGRVSQAGKADQARRDSAG